MGRLLQAIIDRQAFNHNLTEIKQLAPNSKIMAMIKANAYGHGLIETARTLTEVDAFGVACIEEALELRRANIKQRIVLCEGFFHVSELPVIENQDLEIVIHSSYQLELLQKFTGLIQVWLKIDTGMNRLGFSLIQAEKAFKEIKGKPNLMLKGLMTHFSDADNSNSDKTNQQIDRFSKIITTFDKIDDKKYPLSMANSAGILAWKNSHSDWIRPGLMLYGVSPFKDKIGADFNLRPVMSLETNIIAIKEIKAGETIGYSSRFISKKDMLIGVVAVGYGDGYSAKIPDGTPVLVGGERSEIVGQVSMDMAMIDLTKHTNVKVDDKVRLWGEDLPVELISKHANIISHELLASLGTRVYRKFV